VQSRARVEAVSRARRGRAKVAAAEAGVETARKKHVASIVGASGTTTGIMRAARGILSDATDEHDCALEALRRPEAEAPGYERALAEASDAAEV
jgi:hypothetical protein